MEPIWVSNVNPIIQYEEKSMFRMFLFILLTLSLGLADEKKEKSVIKKKVVMIASGNEQENRDINVEANIDDEILLLL